MRRTHPFLLHLLLAAPLLLLDSAALHAEDEAAMGEEMGMPVAEGFVDLTQATVMGSVGCPPALFSHLPGGKVPEAIRWPLPKGPLLLLGLPSRDDVAFEVAEALGLIQDPDELAGGYRAWAWESGGRGIAVILAADPTAMFATRFLFEAAARPEAVNPSMRTVDVKGSDGSASVWMRIGSVAHQPAARVRAWVPPHPLTYGDVLAAAGANVNEIWIRPEKTVPWRVGVRAFEMGMSLHQIFLNGTVTNTSTKTSRTLGDTDPRTGLRVVKEPDGSTSLLDRRNDSPLRQFVPTRYAETANVLQGGRYELERLAALWNPDAPISDPAADMAQYFPVRDDELASVLSFAISALRANRRVPWSAAVASQLEAAQKLRTQGVDVHLVRTVLDPIVLDGAMTDRAWAFAKPLHKRSGLRVISTGTSLIAACDARFRVTINVTDRMGVARGKRAANGSFAETEFDARDLRGAAHAGRLVQFDIEEINPKSPGMGVARPEGYLVIVP